MTEVQPEPDRSAVSMRDGESTGHHPSVSVVIPTYNRPALMRLALESVLRQQYAGAIEVIIVFDKSEPDLSLERTNPGRVVRVMANDRTPGLAGSRNTGILAATGELVAFCDDDDTWNAAKLAVQVDALLAVPDAEFVTTAMTVDYEGRSSVRRAGADRVHYIDLLRSRMAALHSSSFLVKRSALVNDIGLVDETLPQSMAEDRELLLRAARRHAIVHVDAPLVNVRWGATSYFAQQWDLRNQAQLWLLEHYPDIADDRRASSLLYGKVAFGCAAQGRRRDAFRWAARSARSDPLEPRLYLAVGVAMGIIPWKWLLRQLNERGHGI